VEAFVKRSDKILLWLLGTLALLVLLCGACIVGVVVLPVRWWSHGSAVQASKDFLASSSIVKEQVGQIRGFGWVPSGSLHETNGKGQAHLTFSLKGEKGDAKATLDLTKEPGGPWKVKSATLFKEGRSFALTDEPSPGGPAGGGTNQPSSPAEPPPAQEGQDSEGLPA
jgi:hypothetical protein